MKNLKIVWKKLTFKTVVDIAIVTLVISISISLSIMHVNSETNNKEEYQNILMNMDNKWKVERDSLVSLNAKLEEQSKTYYLKEQDLLRQIASKDSIINAIKNKHEEEVLNIINESDSASAYRAYSNLRGY